MRRRHALAVLATLAVVAPAVVPLITGSASAAAVDMCQGQPVTLVANENQFMATDGPDVIVVEGDGDEFLEVFAQGGDDLICVRDGVERPVVIAGPGDDSVTVESTDGTLVETSAVLGSGDDRYVGGPLPDLVTDLAYPVGDGTYDYRQDSGDDIIRTLGGDDVALAGGREGPAQLDGIDLGEGDDVLQVGASGTTAASRLRGGPGTDRVVLFSIPERRMVMDIPQRRAGLLGSRALAQDWRDIEEHEVRVNYWDCDCGERERSPASVTVRGTPSRDVVVVATDDDLGSAVLDVQLLGGDDDLLVDSRSRGRANGGDGRDRIGVTMWYPQPYRLDLGAGRLARSGSSSGLTVARFQDARAVSYDARLATLVGDADPNRITGCAVMHGGPGNDVIGPVLTPTSSCFGGIRAYGGPGDDRLLGSPADDVLTGDGGRDSAEGGAGTDTCSAEQRISCER